MSSVKTSSSRTSARITKAEEYDLVMLGSGFGSKFLAWTFAEQGQRVATIERKYLGGSCPNIACLPSKNIIHSAKVASYFRVPIRKVQQCAMIFRCIKLPACLGFVDPAVFAIWARA